MSMMLPRANPEALYTATSTGVSPYCVVTAAKADLTDSSEVTSQGKLEAWMDTIK